MNQRKFKKIINCSFNNNSVTNLDIEFICKGYSKNSIQNKKLYDLIKYNFYDIINHRADGYLDSIIKEILRYDEVRNIIYEKFLYLLNISSKYELEKILNINYFFDINTIINYNFKYILDNFNIDKLIIINSNIKLSNENITLLNNKYYEKIDEFINELFDNKIIILCKNEKNMYKFMPIIKMIIDELINNEKINLTDIHTLKSGNYSNVIQIGNKILKIGIPRKTFYIPNSKYILKPIIRKDLREISDIPIVIEVIEKVDTNINLNDDALYQIYKNFRKEGIIYADIKSDNIGILLKDNIVYYDNISLDQIVKGFDKNSVDILKKGEYIIIDTDYIYREDDNNITYPSYKSKIFEKRYLEEINKKI